MIDFADARAWICGSSGTTAPWTWDVHPVVVTSLVLVSAIYAAGVVRLTTEKRLPAAAKPRAAAFATGIAALAVVLTSPLDGWADVLFSTHMAQHLVLMMIAPPLLVLGHPIVVALWALPRDQRHAVGGWWTRSRVVRPVVDTVRSPLPAWLAASAALWFWHLPRPYAIAFDHAFAHGLEHLSFFVTSILFWRVVIEDPQSRRLSLGAAMLFVATFAIENAMLAAILTFAPRVLYVVHASVPSWSPLTPLEDQQLAGILMWSVTGVIDLLAMGVLFVALLSTSRRRTAHA